MRNAHKSPGKVYLKRAGSQEGTCERFPFQIGEKRSNWENGMGQFYTCHYASLSY